MIAVYLLLIVLVPLVLGIMITYKALPWGSACPLCRAGTLRLQSRPLRWLSVPLRQRLDRRWCMECGWEGVAYVPADAVRPPAGPVRKGGPTAGAGGTTEAGAPAAPRRRTREAVDVRHLEVDGEFWRVLLQCWHEQGRWYGQLLFNAPSGRILADPQQKFTGGSLNDLLGQALGISERVLANRVRQVASD